VNGVPAAAPAALTFELVPFAGTKGILAARDADTVYVPMKGFCSSIGLPWDGARRRIERDQVLKEGAVMMTVPSRGGAQVQQTLPLDLIPGFLFGAEVSRLAPAVREKIGQYRRNCYRVLYQHFFGSGEREGAVITAAPSPATTGAADIVLLVERLRTEPAMAVRFAYQALLAEACGRAGVETPLVPLERADAPCPARRIDELLSGLQALDRRHVRYNHYGASAQGRIAINLPQLARLFARHDIDVAIDDALRESLRAGDPRWTCTIRTIDSAIGLFRRPTHCHVLERAL